MKKSQTPSKKLNLRRERVRVLLDTELAVAGARRACSDMDSQHSGMPTGPDADPTMCH